MSVEFGDPRLPARFWSKVEVDKETGCFVWTAYVQKDGYGQFNWGGAKLAHRVAYSELVGPIPEGMEIDHVKARGCTSRACVNPLHLEPVTHQENVDRGDLSQNGERNRVKTHCPVGHEYSEQNTRYRRNGERVCRECHRVRMRASYTRMRGAA